MSLNLEAEFQMFLKAGFGHQELHPSQKRELRRAFYGGVAIGVTTNPKQAIDQCRHFFIDFGINGTSLNYHVVGFCYGKFGVDYNLWSA